MSRTIHMPISQLLETAVREIPEQEAIYDYPKRITYRELYEEVNKLVLSLLALGIEKGDKVGIALPNWYETVQLYFAVSKIGAIIVPFNPRYRTTEVDYIIDHSDLKLIFVSKDFENVDLHSLKAKIPTIITVRYSKSGSICYSELVKNVGNQDSPFTIDKEIEEIFCILYTSGSTGKPKGVMVTNECILHSGITISEKLKCNSSDVFIVTTPLFHIFGIACNLVAAIYSKARMVLQEKYSVKGTLRLIEEEKVTVHNVVPTMLNLELKQLELESYDLSSLRVGITGAAPCPPATLLGVKEKMGMKIFVSYGTTETGTITITDYEEADKNLIETVGKPIEGVEIKLVDDQRKTISEMGVIGEITYRGFGLMKGYYKSPIQTQEVVNCEGWYFTGDLGKLDNNGYLTFIGRKKEMILKGGFNIFPQEIENIIQRHPKIRSAVVFGAPDKILGEVVCLAVQLEPNASMTETEIFDFLTPLLANYKLPSNIYYVDHFPQTASGKINKLKAIERFRDRISD